MVNIAFEDDSLFWKHDFVLYKAIIVITIVNKISGVTADIQITADNIIQFRKKAVMLLIPMGNTLFVMLI